MGKDLKKMSNSPLVEHVKISPNKTSPRTRKIDTISIHCVAGNCCIERVGSIFSQPSRQASSNYCVDSDGRVGMYVEEKDCSWCSSSLSNDHRAVTIEVANDGGAPDWHVSDKAINSLILLIADICERNHIPQLLWKGDKNLIGQIDKQNMTVHRWFANKSCPGNYLYNKHGYIAEEVNKLLKPITLSSGTPILGENVVSADSLSQLLLEKNPHPKLNNITPLQLAQLYLDEGESEGVRGDIAFCQSGIETGWWKFGNDVKPEQNNFSGIGATGGGNPGNFFRSPQEGVRAQIQHLKAYATTDALNQPCVDPRYNLVQKGCAPTWEDLSGRWATDKNYASKILTFYNQLIFKSSDPEPTPSAPIFEPYTIKIKVSALNVRKGPGTNHAIARILMNDKNIYTIIEESEGPGASMWCKLKSGIGWVSKDFITKL